MATDSFSGIADVMFECDWHEYPIEHQKIFILIIENAQQPIQFDGFEIAILNLETFCMV